MTTLDRDGWSFLGSLSSDLVLTSMIISMESVYKQMLKIFFISVKQTMGVTLNETITLSNGLTATNSYPYSERE